MRFKLTAMTIVLAVSCAAAAFAQDNNQKAAGQPPIEEIIKRFTAAESQNKIARTNYAFTQDVDIMTLGQAGSITGRYRRTSDIVLDDLGNRIEKITFFPPSTLTEVTLTQEDLQDIGGVQPFALTAEDLPKYHVTYVGKEKLDELNTYIFDVKPKKIVKGERYLEGRIWVDDEDLQIVKTAGKAVPEVGEQKFPRFESYRENIDERYWFPTYVHSDDVLEFKRSSVHLRMTIRYTKYKKFSGSIRIGDDGEEAKDEDGKEPQKAKPADKKSPPAGTKPPDKKPPTINQ
jgi:hypothetical protein